MGIPSKFFDMAAHGLVMEPVRPLFRLHRLEFCARLRCLVWEALVWEAVIGKR
jgi:hypothetical protein